MDNELYRLVYFSRNRIPAASGDFEAQVDDILARSRQNNARDAITGALLFNAGCFAQVLEGPLAPVEDAFERIQQDERHDDVALLMLEPVASRSFPNWAMGFVGRSADIARRFGGIGAGSGFDPARMTGEHIHALLTELALEEETPAG